MGDWHNSKEAKELRRARENHVAAGRPPLKIGVIQGEKVAVSDALWCRVMNHLHLKRNIGTLCVVRDILDREQPKAWAQATGVRIEFCSQHHLLTAAHSMHGIIAICCEDWVARRLRSEGWKVWEPVRPLGSAGIGSDLRTMGAQPPRH